MRNHIIDSEKAQEHLLLLSQATGTLKCLQALHNSGKKLTQKTLDDLIDGEEKYTAILKKLEIADLEEDDLTPSVVIEVGGLPIEQHGTNIGIMNSGDIVAPDEAVNPSAATAHTEQATNSNKVFE